MNNFRGMHIKEHKNNKEISLHNDTLYFLDPDYVYVPLVELGGTFIPSVKVNEKVKMGQEIALKGGRFPIPIHAPISGEIISLDVRKWHCSGKMVLCIQIKNDFLETPVDTIKPNKVDKLSKDDIIEIMEKCGIVGLGGSGFPTYAKYNQNLKIDTLIINGVECEPYLTDDYILMRDNFDGIIKGCQYLLKAAEAKIAYIAVKKNKKELIDIINKGLESIDNIKLYLVDDVYPAGWEKYLVNKIANKCYKSIPCEVGVIVNNVSTVFAVKEAVENNMPIIKKTFTLSGNGIVTPRNVCVKIGTLISDIVRKNGGYIDYEKLYFVAGGPLTGKSLVSDEMVVNRALTSVLVLEVSDRINNLECMGCGQCVTVCPVKLSPIFINTAFKMKNKEQLVKLSPNKCIACGLCSYVCPSRLELTVNVLKAKDYLARGN